MNNGSITVGVDTGGTFTDLVACDAQGIVRWATKASSTPDDPSRGILDALEIVASQDVGVLLHGTTIGTNALLERRGARTALLITRGFRDIPELARQNRPNLYDWFQAKAKPLVPRELRFEVDERVAPNEAAQVPLNSDQAVEVIRALRERGVESVAVSLLHSYRDDTNERRLGELLATELPTAHVSLSSQVLPEIMEYERTSTTIANAYLAPVMEGYLSRLLKALQNSEVKARLFVMQSNGGLGSAETIGRRAVQTVLSGPAAGVVGGLASTGGSSKPNFLTIDMGGTSFDIAYAEGREPNVSRESVVDGLPIAVPSLDIHTLGAGGGSIAWIDAGGALRVGPQSAGSVPGPACYARGGALPTVTDANLVLGRLASELLGGRLVVDLGAAQRALEQQVARPLGISLVAAARGILEVVNASMAKGMHLMTVARGRDPRDLSVVAFGGAGPLHACDLASAIGSDEVIIPTLPGNTSAIGLVLASVRRERSQAVLAPLADISDGEAASKLDQLAMVVVAQLLEDGIQPDAVRLFAIARISYEGQRYQIDVPWSHQSQWRPGRGFSGSVATAADGFRRRHLATYGYTRQEPLWLFSLVVAGLASASQPISNLQFGLTGNPTARQETRRVWMRDDFYETRIVQRTELQVDQRVVGPTVIEQADATTFVPSDWHGVVDKNRNLILRRAP